MTAKSETLGRLHEKEARSVHPFIGTVEFSDLAATTLKSDIPYVTSSNEKPAIVMALSGFSTTAYEDQSVFLFTTSQKDSTFDLLCDTWLSRSANITRSIKANWLELQHKHTGSGVWQHGEWISKKDDSAPTDCNTADAIIEFAKPYDAAPEVVVFISGFHADHRKHLRVKIGTDNITTTGFTLKVRTWDNSKLFNIKVSWIAYPADLPGVHSGSVNTNQFRTWENAQHINMGYEAFPPGKFGKSPKVMVGFNVLDLACKKDQNIKAFVSNLSQVGMCWNTDSWGETVNYGAGLSYLAIASEDSGQN
ncbi:hypothetical protein BJ508DRAFT_212785 [Ascobolus immersus RN42]|uniref:H-type lectin domain-containing protein n=1 Tax=Ascobolus immersus RN42 TaxID=1160509 RepID=A0A3N4HUK3_ASCIM|nr:hypothetical protein BJ508DRAFT_212785 [Ascobolus immersus RN42]